MLCRHPDSIKVVSSNNNSQHIHTKHIVLNVYAVLQKGLMMSKYPFSAAIMSAVSP
jgi:hypothetical protein